MLAPARGRHLCRRHLRRRRLQPRHPRRAGNPGDRHRPRPHGDRRRLRSGRTLGGPADAGRGPLLQSRRGLRGARRRCRRRRRDGRRGVLDAARPGRPRLLVPPRRSARHADGADGADAPPMSSRAPPKPISPTSSIIFGEERHSRRVARAIVADAQGDADHDHARARRYRRQGGAVEARRNPSGDADVSGPAHFRQRRARRTPAARSRPPSACSSRAAGSWWSRSIRWKTASSRISSPSAARPAAARGICRKWRKPRRAFSF